MDVSDSPVLTSLLTRLGMMKPSETGGARRRKTGKNSGKGVSDRELNAFEKRLDKVLSHQKAGVQERVYLIGLEKVREKLGKRWKPSQNKIHATIKSIINTRLTPQDVHIKYDDVSYLIVFTSLGSREAQIKCSVINEEILNKLLGSKSGAEFVDVKKVNIGEDNRVQFENLPKLEDIVGDTIRNLSENNQEGESQDRQISVARKQDVGLIDEDVQFIFRPLVTLKTKIISTFMCMPVRARLNGFASGYDVLENPSDPSRILALDMRTLEIGIGALNSLLAEEKKSLVELPVHFETLANFERRLHYIKAVNEMFSGNEKRVVFEIVGLPDGIPQVRLSEMVSTLHPHSRAVMARFSLDHTSFPEFRTGGLHAVGIDLYATDEKEAVIMKKMEVFVTSADKNHLKTYVLGLRSISLFTAAVTEGFDYIAGHALTAASETAEDISAFNFGMPYLSLLKPETVE